MSETTCDALSAIVRGLKLRAEVYVNADFCGTWAIDTSGSRRVPFHLLGSGACWLHLTGQPARLLTAGQLVLFPHDQSHVLSSLEQQPPTEIINQQPEENSGDTTSLVCGFFEFASKSNWPLLDSLPEVIVLDLNDTERMGDTHSLIQLMTNELNDSRPGSEAVVNELAYILFIHILRSQIVQGLNKGLLAALFDTHIGQGLTLIHRQPERQWSVELLARETGLSRSVFAERFKQLVGMAPVRYLTEWRMREATELLQQSELSVAAIAERCGYNSEIAFRKAFKSVTGSTPGEIRRADR